MRCGILPLYPLLKWGLASPVAVLLCLGLGAPTRKLPYTQPARLRTAHIDRSAAAGSGSTVRFFHCTHQGGIDQARAMVTRDLCLAWNWEYDFDFVTLLNTACQAKGLSLLQVTPHDLQDLLPSLAEQQIDFRAFFDRASEDDARFTPLVRWVREHGIFCINAYERASRTWDKAAMHVALVNAGLHVPYTTILPAYEELPVLAPVDLGPLGEQFTIKPAHGSGGEGVVARATSWNHVLRVRQEHATDKYLLQAHVVPRELDSRPAWFRVLYCAGRVYPCWWNPHTHVYKPVTSAEQSGYRLDPIHDTTVSIARLCGLDLFSTEIALTSDGPFAVVDYVNDQIDMRLQSKTVDGVPDDIVRDIAERLVGLVAVHYPSVI
jgi:hypothetical protein